MVSEIPRVSVFENCPYSVTFPYRGTPISVYRIDNYADFEFVPYYFECKLLK